MVRVGKEPLDEKPRIARKAWLAAAMPVYREVSRFPSVTRDLALVMSRDQAVEPLLGALRVRAPAIVSDIRLFDLYQGKGLPEGQKSLAFRIVMQDTQRTLQDTEVELAVQQLVSCLEQAFAAQLRA